MKQIAKAHNVNRLQNDEYFFGLISTIIFYFIFNSTNKRFFRILSNSYIQAIFKCFYVKIAYLTPTETLRARDDLGVQGTVLIFMKILLFK